MAISELLLSEFEQEMEKTRAILERVPAGKGDYAPHPKSMPLGKLATHVAQLAEFGHTVLTTPEMDFATANFQWLPFESGEQLVKFLDEEASKVSAALAKTTDHDWQQNWRLLIDGKPIFEGTRFLAYRGMFLNHVVHHRAQLGVYLRLNGISIPGTYGPSADEPWKG